MYISKQQNDFTVFARVIFSRNFAYAKFHENKTLAKISEITVLKFCLIKWSLLKRQIHCPGYADVQASLCIFVFTRKAGYNIMSDAI